MALQQTNPPSKPASGRIRLDYLDGIRGIAAFYVVLHHAYSTLGHHGNGAGLPRSLALLTNWLAFGHTSVAIFIVLSGYCLMLPLARRNTAIFPEGTLSFLKRRAWRIAPPYYAALVFSLICIALSPALRSPHLTLWDNCIPAFTPGVLISHLFIVHNLSPEWLFKIDYPMWSVSTEWEIYFVFAFLLLPVLRRFGMVLTVLTAFALGIAAGRVMPWANFHFIGLFALGMLAASVNFGPEDSRLRRLETRMPWIALSLILMAAFCFLCRKGVEAVGQHVTVADLLVGFATTCLLIRATRHSRQAEEGRRGVLMNLLESRAIVGLGAFSYSLYLAHAPILALIQSSYPFQSLPTGQALLLYMAISVPCSLVFSYGFYLLFEKPALKMRDRSRQTP